MRIAKLIGAAGRMQRIAEQHEAGKNERRVGRGNMRRCASSHRLAADEQTLARTRELRARRFDDGTITGYELRHAIGNLSPLLGIEKIERHDVEAAFAERARETHHERMQLRRAGAVREDERCRKPGLRLRRVDQSSGGLTRGDINGDLLHVDHPL